MTYNKKVIPFPVSAPTTWSFEDYVSPDGNDLIQDWCDRQSDEFNDMMESTLKDMAKTANHLNWNAWRRFLEGEAKTHRIWEMGFFADGKQYRFFCLFAGEKVVILLVGCYHKQKRYTPDDAILTAIKRARLLKDGIARTYARQIDTTL